jgi:hypothetical protein
LSLLLIKLKINFFFRSNFRPSVYWYRDGTRLTNDDDPSNRIRIGHIGRKHILSVASISADRDSGMYTCHAINDIGEAKENFQILTGKQKQKQRWKQNRNGSKLIKKP